MATPADLEDFAIGFSLTEGHRQLAGPRSSELEIVIETNRHRAAHVARRHRAQPRSPSAGAPSPGRPAAVFAASKSWRRRCGPCRDVRRAGRSRRTRSCRAMAGAHAARRRSTSETHAVHAAAFWTPRPGLVALREDVGRHNALDKLAGALARGPKASDGHRRADAAASRSNWCRRRR